MVTFAVVRVVSGFILCMEERKKDRNGESKEQAKAKKRNEE